MRARDADDWWASLTGLRREQIWRWVSDAGGSRGPLPDEQFLIDDEMLAEGRDLQIGA